MGKPSLSKIASIVIVPCVATAIASRAQTLTTLANFSLTNGAAPNASLVEDIDGNFYGTTNGGGANSYGTVFKITPTPPYTLTTLYNFCSQTGCTDGSEPPAGLVQGSDGDFYGTTTRGGANCTGCGTVFKITTKGKLTTLHSFDGFDGFAPTAPLVQGTDGNFYGTTYEGGANSYGTVFKITPTPPYTLTTLYSFCAQTNCTDGKYPDAGLVQGTDGNFYGTTYGGGTGDNCTFRCGTVFKMTAEGTLTTLHSFDGTDGSEPQAGLVQGTDGNFYGTTYEGGTNGYGTVFKITPGGTLTTLHSFDGTDGEYPSSAPVQATDGNFYGATGAGGANDPPSCTQGSLVGCGTLFKMTPEGMVTTLHSFDFSDGEYPSESLVQGTDGNFYGSTLSGGTSGNCYVGCGTVFSLSVGLSPFVETQPTFGMVGAPVTILGTNLTGATNVTFNGTAATINSNTGSAITTSVPAGATTGTVQVTTPGGTLTSNADFQVTGPIQFIPVTPCRLVDTRNTGGPIQGGTSRSFTIPQLGGCGIPASAAAYALNVTLVPPGPVGYLTIWPEGEIQPFVSTMNSPDGRTKANAAIVPSGNNAVSVYVSNTTNLLLDIDGYFAPPGSQTYQFYPLTPCRIVDTRNGQDQGPLQAGVERDYVIPGTNNCGVPSTAIAYSFNVTVLPTQGSLDYLTLWPQGEQRPTVSTLNDRTGTVVANAAIVPAGSNNTTAFYAHNHNTDLLLDVNGYFAPAGSGGLSLYPVTPCRVLDTRSVGNGQPFQGELTVNVVGSACAPPANAATYVFNATVVPPGPMPFLTLWPDGEQQPTVSTLNARDGFITSNMAIVPTNNGSIDTWAQALTQLLLDISGYFAP